MRVMCRMCGGGGCYVWKDEGDVWKGEGDV